MVSDDKNPLHAAFIWSFRGIGFIRGFPYPQTKDELIMNYLQIVMVCLGGFFSGYVAGSTQRILRRAFEVIE